MKLFRCDCGQSVFFDSTDCVHCGAVFGFDDEILDVVAMRPRDDGAMVDASGRVRRVCSNGSEFGVCNWLVPEGDEKSLCWACQFNRTIPDQSKPQNTVRWRRFETAKKRLLYTLRALGLPVHSGWEDAEAGLLFDFIEDQRSDPERYPESFVQTGFHGGLITINTLEADDAAREDIRTQMNERYRTLLGHLRHESGHYYASAIQADTSLGGRFRELFGDIDDDYQQALERYYASGPAFGWQDHHISAYASAHPSEDWAETWAHYLFIYDALETAAAHDIVATPPENMTVGERVKAWRELSVVLNELNRSSGLGDAYPFVLNDVVAEKIGFVDEVVTMLSSRGRAWADC